MSATVLAYLQDVLGVKSILREPPSEIGTSDEGDLRSTEVQVFGGVDSPYALVISSPYLNETLSVWSDGLHHMDRETLEKLIKATGYLPEQIRIIFVSEDEECVHADTQAAWLTELLPGRPNLLMGRLLGASLWGPDFRLEKDHGRSRMVNHAQVVPVHGLLEINSDGQLKRLLWNDIKSVLKSILKPGLKS